MRGVRTRVTTEKIENDKSDYHGVRKYYVPEKSRLAICATIGLILSIFGAASIMNDMTLATRRRRPAPGPFSLGMLFSSPRCSAGFVPPSRKTSRA